jgi:hypothetical protein
MDDIKVDLDNRLKIVEENNLAFQLNSVNENEDKQNKILAEVEALKAKITQDCAEKKEVRQYIKDQRKWS